MRLRSAWSSPGRGRPRCAPTSTRPESWLRSPITWRRVTDLPVRAAHDPEHAAAADVEAEPVQDAMGSEGLHVLEADDDVVRARLGLCSSVEEPGQEVVGDDDRDDRVADRAARGATDAEGAAAPRAGGAGDAAMIPPNTNDFRRPRRRPWGAGSARPCPAGRRTPCWCTGHPTPSWLVATNPPPMIPMVSQSTVSTGAMTMSEEIRGTTRKDVRSIDMTSRARARRRRTWSPAPRRARCRSWRRGRSR